MTFTDQQRADLQAAIAADPRLAAMQAVADDIGLAAALNSKTIAGNVYVSTAEVKRRAILQGYFGAIVLASRATPADPTQAAAMGAAIAAVGYVDDPRYSAMDMSLPEVQQMIAALVAGGVMTQAQSDDLLAMGNGQISIAEQACGVGTVLTSDDVGALR